MYIGGWCVLFSILRYCVSLFFQMFICLHWQPRYLICLDVETGEILLCWNKWVLTDNKLLVLLGIEKPSLPLSLFSPTQILTGFKDFSSLKRFDLRNLFLRVLTSWAGPIPLLETLTGYRQWVLVPIFFMFIPSYWLNVCWEKFTGWKTRSAAFLLSLLLPWCSLAFLNSRRTGNLNLTWCTSVFHVVLLRVFRKEERVCVHVYRKKIWN